MKSWVCKPGAQGNGESQGYTFESNHSTNGCSHIDNLTKEKSDFF